MYVWFTKRKSPRSTLPSGSVGSRDWIPVPTSRPERCLAHLAFERLSALRQALMVLKRHIIPAKTVRKPWWIWLAQLGSHVPHELITGTKKAVSSGQAELLGQSGSHSLLNPKPINWAEILWNSRRKVPSKEEMLSYTQDTWNGSWY